MRVLSAALAVAALAVAAFAAPATAADDKPPTLLGRAILPSDAYQPGPPSGRSSPATTASRRRSRASPSLASRRY
jgi:hypothetical protein